MSEQFKAKFPWGTLGLSPASETSKLQQLVEKTLTRRPLTPMSAAILPPGSQLSERLEDALNGTAHLGEAFFQAVRSAAGLSP